MTFLNVHHNGVVSAAAASNDTTTTTTTDSLLNSELYSTSHDRQRRDQRMIDKEDQLRARRYGMCEYARNGRLKYTHNNKVFIWCPISNRAVTCWNVPLHPEQQYQLQQQQNNNHDDSDEASDGGGDRILPRSGTAVVDPILIQKSLHHATPFAETAHTLVTHQIQNQPGQWKSHTVLVVDMSGSMRIDDVNGARCRSDGVWTCLAKDFVQHQIQDGKTSLQDVVSVILMRDTAQVVIDCEPTDYVLYNKLVELREWTTERPSGHGNYGPALEQAEELLLHRNPFGSCALALVFFSDGRPSDWNKQELPAKMGALASRFGRRLSITCVGMAGRHYKYSHNRSNKNNHNNQKLTTAEEEEAEDDFQMLRQMVAEAQAYGAVATFHKPSMTTDSLSQLLSSHVTSSLASTKTELTNLNSGQTMTVRTDLIRERCNAPDDVAPTEDWKLFCSTTSNTLQQYTLNVWTWNPHCNNHNNHIHNNNHKSNHNNNKRRTNKHNNGDFSRLLDPRCASCYQVTVLSHALKAADPQKGVLCYSCKACFFCWSCVHSKRAGRYHNKSKCHEFATLRRQGAIMPLSETLTIPSFDVAWKQHCFGEGAERVAFKFRFLQTNPQESTSSSLSSSLPYSFVGPPMVAKESRFVDDDGIQNNNNNNSTTSMKSPQDYLTTNQHRYHVAFMQTQFLASQFAIKYNDTLQGWMDHLNAILRDEEAVLKQQYEEREKAIQNNPKLVLTLPSISTLRLSYLREWKERVRHYPRIRFLQPRIFELTDRQADKTYNILVEPMIQGTYRKYNNNNGGLVNQPKFEAPPQQQTDTSINPSLAQLLLGSPQKSGAAAGGNTNRPAMLSPSAFSAINNGAGSAVPPALGAIEEGDSEEEEYDDDEDESSDEEDAAAEEEDNHDDDDKNKNKINNNNNNNHLGKWRPKEELRNAAVVGLDQQPSSAAKYQPPRVPTNGENRVVNTNANANTKDQNNNSSSSNNNNNHNQKDDHTSTDFFQRLVRQEQDNDKNNRNPTSWGDRKLPSSHVTIPDEDFMQAFSHFSFAKSGGRLIVVDLQGTLQEVKKPAPQTRTNNNNSNSNANDDDCGFAREFVLTDPAIHKRRQSQRLKHMKFGRTDRGDRGIKDFFATHECNDACRLLGLRPRISRKKMTMKNNNNSNKNNNDNNHPKKQ